MISATVLRNGGGLTDGAAPLTAGADNAARDRNGGVRNTTPASLSAAEEDGTALAPKEPGLPSWIGGDDAEVSPKSEAAAEVPVNAERFCMHLLYSSKTSLSV